jgi:TRAP-type C4-dicarboxylate transport system substrate-binding protein
MTIRIKFAAAIIAVAALPSLVAADVEWDVSVPWSPSEFHSINAENFARQVEQKTGGTVMMTVHPGGALGIKANESLRAVEDGAVQMGEYALFQQVGEVPLLGIESIPFLIKDYAQLRQMHELVRPVWEEQLKKRNQKALYIVPWPSQNFFTKEPVSSMADLAGVRFRTYDANTATMITRLGGVPLQLNNADVVPALATGKLDAAMTSGSTAAAQKYWQFLNHTYNTNHLWASNGMVVNLEVWNELTSEQRTIIEGVAAEMEPNFWAISEAEHAKRMQQLIDNGMTVSAPSEALAKDMRRETADMANEFADRVEGADAIIKKFIALTGG